MAVRDHPGLAPWLVIAAGVCAALHLAKLSPALPVLRETLGLGLLQAGFLLSLVQLAGMLFGLLLGAATDVIGLKRSMVAGLLLLSMAAAAGGWSSSAVALLLWRALEGVGFLLAVLPAPGLVRQLVPAGRLKAALGYWGAYMPLGTALALLLGPVVLYATDWRVWWWCLASLSGASAFCLWRWVPSPVLAGAANVSRPGIATSPGDIGSLRARLGRTVSSSGPWLLALSFAAYSAQWLAVIGFLPSIAAQNGSLGLAAAPLLAIAALVNVVGNVASGRLLQCGVPAHVLLQIGFCAMALGAVAAFADWPGAGGTQSLPVLRYAGVLVFSMVGGLVPGTLFSLATVLAPDDSSVATTVGWMQQWSAAGQLLGPPLVGWLASRAGGWQWTWCITTLCSLTGVLLARRIARKVVQ